MTNKEALEYATSICYCCGCSENLEEGDSVCDDCKHKDFFNIAQEALEKQIEKKPYRIHANIFHCGNDKNCDAFFTESDEYRYCPFCGTKIDWSGI